MNITIEQVLIEIARNSILSEFNKAFSFDKESLLKEFPSLNEQRACFVTLNLNGNLRACMGSLVAHRTLIDDIFQNAYNSAFSDLRFNRLTYDEFKNVDIEISILSPAIKLDYINIADLKSKIKENEHGVILELDGKKSTFLPQVWEQLNTFDEFFTHLSRKAGFTENCLDKLPNIYIYTVTKIK